MHQYLILILILKNMCQYLIHNVHMHNLTYEASWQLLLFYFVNILKKDLKNFLLSI